MTVAANEESRLAVDDEHVATLRRAVLVLSRRLRYQQAGEDMSSSEASVLAHLALGAATPGQLAKWEHVQPPSMTKIIERLEARGFVKREPDPTDRRQVLLTRTDAGNEYAERTRQIRNHWLGEQLGRLDAAEQKVIVEAADALKKLAELA